MPAPVPGIMQRRLRLAIDALLFHREGPL